MTSNYIHANMYSMFKNDSKRSWCQNNLFISAFAIISRNYIFQALTVLLAFFHDGTSKYTMPMSSVEYWPGHYYIGILSSNDWYIINYWPLCMRRPCHWNIQISKLMFGFPLRHSFHKRGWFAWFASYPIHCNDVCFWATTKNNTAGPSLNKSWRQMLVDFNSHTAMNKIRKTNSKSCGKQLRRANGKWKDRWWKRFIMICVKTYIIRRHIILARKTHYY